MMKKTLILVTAAAVMALSLFGSASLALMVADREPPVRYERARPLAASVPQGGTIDIEFTVFRAKICDADVTRLLTDADNVRHSISGFTVGLQRFAGEATYRRAISIPDSAAVGPASYQASIQYSCNVLHRLGWPIVVQSPVVRFDITPRALITLPPLLPPVGDDG